MIIFSISITACPRIYAADIKHGLALIEPLGDKVFSRMMARGDDMGEPMKAAVEVLADMAARDWPSKVPVRGGTQPSHCQL